GIDAIFENVGGERFDDCLLRMNPFGRIALCGMIAAYEKGDLPIKNARILLSMRLTVRGFIISEHLDLWPQGLKELGALLATGKIKFRETIASDLSAAPEAFIGLLTGKNFGKQLVKLL
ncbi:MAG: zinc-binding dehydrogenase, partial [Burkholderiaceae bacterium]|nr:zinc-binding dehydrogenase [Burkholderiaceae bacterium]